MAIADLIVTKENIDQCGWQEIISTCTEKTYHAYFSALSMKANEADIEGNREKRDALHLLAAAMMLHLREENAEPFGPIVEMEGRRSPIPIDFTVEHLELFTSIAPTISDPELQARLADIVWVRKYNGKIAAQMARVAVAAYMASARMLEDPEIWPYCFERIRRAQQIAASLGRSGPLPVVITFIEEMLHRYNGTDPSVFFCKLMELLQGMNQGDPAVYAPIADIAAQFAEQARDWSRTQAYLIVLARWYARARDAESEQAVWRRYAETYVQEAEDALNRPASPYGIASHFLQQAIEAFRNHVRDSQVRREELHRRLLDYQQRSMGELAAMPYSIDIADMVDRTEQAVSDKPLMKALCALAVMSKPTSKQLLAEMAERHEQSFISRLFPRVLLNEQGKVVARQDATLGDGEEAAAARQAEMLHNAVMCRNLVAHGIVWPGIQQIMREHAVGVSDLMPLMRDAPFVPYGREEIVTRGLQAGLNGDFLVATHLLVPQVEQAVRQLLARTGVITSTLDQLGIQKEVSLDELLLKPELEGILDADTIFDLRGLLVEQHGSNLRNLMAHGLLNPGALSSGEAVYLRWLVLRLCLIPLMNASAQSQQSIAEEEISGTSTDAGSEGENHTIA